MGIGIGIGNMCITDQSGPFCEIIKVFAAGVQNRRLWVAVNNARKGVCTVQYVCISSDLLVFPCRWFRSFYRILKLSIFIFRGEDEEIEGDKINTSNPFCWITVDLRGCVSACGVHTYEQ